MKTAERYKQNPNSPNHKSSSTHRNPVFQQKTWAGIGALPSWTPSLAELDLWNVRSANCGGTPMDTLKRRKVGSAGAISAPKFSFGMNCCMQNNKLVLMNRLQLNDPQSQHNVTGRPTTIFWSLHTSFCGLQAAISRSDIGSNCSLYLISSSK